MMNGRGQLSPLRRMAVTNSSESDIRLLLPREHGSQKQADLLVFSAWTALVIIEARHEATILSCSLEFLVDDFLRDRVRRPDNAGVTTQAHIERVLLYAVAIAFGDLDCVSVVFWCLLPAPRVRFSSPDLFMAENINCACHRLG